MDIYILNKNKRIQEKLEHDLPSYNVKVYPDIEDFYDYITRSAAIIDMFIVTDGGLNSENGVDLSTKFSLLKRLFEYEYFAPKQVIFLNKEVNESHYAKYNFLKETLIKKGMHTEVIRKPKIELDDLRTLITQSTLSFTPRVTNKKAVVQVKRGSRTLETKVLTGISTDKTVAISFSEIDTVSRVIKENNKNNTTPLSPTDESDMQIPDLPEDFELTFETEDKKQLKHIKYIFSTGDGGTGTSTTALTLALTGCQEEKVLLIDADSCLGLSNLVENLLPYDATDPRKNKYFKIDLEDILKNKDEAIDNILNTEDTSSLHVMTGTLPVIRAIGVETVEYLILNLLSLIEDNYRYIIIDLPFRVLSDYATLLSKADLLLASCPPYLNRVVTLLKNIQSNSIIQSTKAYKNNLLFTYMTGIPDLNGLNTISIREFEGYSEALLGRKIPCMQPYVCNSRNYIAPIVFRSMVEKAETILNRGEGE